MKLSDKIIEIRKKNGLSQEEFGEKINVSRQAVSKWESEQANPDIDKIKEISKQFNVSFDYLLNDEIDKEINYSEQIQTKRNFKKYLKFIGILLIIYLLISIYKFITLFRMYKIADSFSENNFWMSQEIEISNRDNTSRNITKVGNKQITEMYGRSANDDNLIDEYGNVMPYAIEYIDGDAKIAYILNYEKEKEMYVYSNLKDACVDEEEWVQRLEIENIIKETTLSLIPSNAKDLLLQSINPLSFVSNHKISINHLDKTKYQVFLSDDYLVTDYYVQDQFGETFRVNLSYDYVQDHFDDLENPLVTYSSKILK